MSTTSSCQPLGTCNGSEACEWIHWWKHCAFLWVKWLLGSRKYGLCFCGSGKSAHDSGENSFVLQHTKNWRLRSTFGRWRRQNAQEFLMRVPFHFNEFVLPSNHQKLTDQERFWKMRSAELKRTAIYMSQHVPPDINFAILNSQPTSTCVIHIKMSCAFGIGMMVTPKSERVFFYPKMVGLPWKPL